MWTEWLERSFSQSAPLCEVISRRPRTCARLARLFLWSPLAASGGASLRDVAEPLGMLRSLRAVMGLNRALLLLAAAQRRSCAEGPADGSGVGGDATDRALHRVAPGAGLLQLAEAAEPEVAIFGEQLLSLLHREYWGALQPLQSRATLQLVAADTKGGAASGDREAVEAGRAREQRIHPAFGCAAAAA